MAEYFLAILLLLNWSSCHHVNIVIRASLSDSESVRVVPGFWIGQPLSRIAPTEILFILHCHGCSQSSSYTGRFCVPNLSKNEWKDLDRELKPILAPWHEHLAIATSQNISEKLCHSHLCTLSWGALAVQSRAHVCKILLNSNMLRLTYPVEHEFETSLPPLNVLKNCLVCNILFLGRLH